MAKDRIAAAEKLEERAAGASREGLEHGDQLDGETIRGVVPVHDRTINRRRSSVAIRWEVESRHGLSEIEASKEAGAGGNPEV
jgi:hypothetical protein